MKPYTEQWYSYLIQECATLMLGAKNLASTTDYVRYSKLYDYLIKRRKICQNNL